MMDDDDSVCATWIHECNVCGRSFRCDWFAWKNAFQLVIGPNTFRAELAVYIIQMHAHTHTHTHMSHNPFGRLGAKSQAKSVCPRHERHLLTERRAFNQVNRAPQHTNTHAHMHTNWNSLQSVRAWFFTLAHRRASRFRRLTRAVECAIENLVFAISQMKWTVRHLRVECVETWCLQMEKNDDGTEKKSC